ncbi:hypothetical protein [Snodgrassella alvi]|uniref:hypothetical protein n=1 Tax=Snodgrassella alvi TaxID=1196083 RepID=UPI002147FD5C|nr:hypothetical protein [Snodgrassella alvi]
MAVVAKLGQGAGAVGVLDKLAVRVPAQVFVPTSGVGDSGYLAVLVVLVVGTLF